MVKPWHRAFPKAIVTMGNHDALPKRKAVTYGIPWGFFKPNLSDVYGTPGWKWVTEIDIDDVKYLHGKGHGKNAALNTANSEHMSICMGHAHSTPSIQFVASTKYRWFGMNSGCGLDIKAYAFDYQKRFSARPILGCGVVIDGVQPIFIPMEL